MSTVNQNLTRLDKIIHGNSTNSKQGQVKPKYSLNQMQKDFIALQLPKGFSFTLANEIDQKRQRIPKKTDENFQTEYRRVDNRRNVQDKKNQKRDEKRDDKKVKQKRQVNSMNNNEIFQKNLMNDEIKKVFNEQQKQKQNNVKFLQNDGNLGICMTLGNIKEIQKDNVQKVKNCFKQKDKIIEQNNNQFQMKIRRDGEKGNRENLAENCQVQMELKDEPKNDYSSLNGEIHPFKGLTSQQKQQFSRLVSKLKAHKSSWPFRIPVDPIPQGVPNYLKVIHQPMDLKTIEKKLFSQKYEHPGQIYGDINKIFLNSYKFNPKQCQYYSLTVQFEAYYHELLKSQYDILQKLGKNKDKQLIKNQQYSQQLLPIGKKKKFQVPLKVGENMLQIQKRIIGMDQKMGQIQKDLCKQKQKKKYSDFYKKQLVKKIQNLSSKSIQIIVQIVFGNVEQQNMIVELDFEKLSDEKIYEIQRIVQNEIERNQEIKKNLFAFETRFSLF